MAQILVVDDNHDVGNQLHCMLTIAGHSVHLASNGKRAIASFQLVIPEVIICDLFMPEMQGFDTIAALRWLAPKIPIIAISGSSHLGMPDALRETLAHGASVALARPFDVYTLLNTIETMVDMKAY